MKMGYFQADNRWGRNDFHIFIVENSETVYHYETNNKQDAIAKYDELCSIPFVVAGVTF